MKAARTPPHFATLACLSAVATLTLSMFLPSLPAMAEAFGVDYALMNLAVAGYLGVTTVVQLVAGPLSDRYGRRPVLLGALAIFTLASLGCMLAEDIRVFLAFRVFQAAMISGSVIALAVIRDTSPPTEAASRIGYLSMAMAIAPMTGPMIGGALDALVGWRAIFFTLSAAGALLLILCWADLGETNRRKSASLTEQARGYPALFRSPRFWAYAICGAFSTSAFYAFLTGIPLVAREVLDMPVAEIGFYLGSITGGFFVGSFLSGRFAKRAGLTNMLLIGRVVPCTGLSVGVLLFLSGEITPLAVFGTTLSIGIGNGLTMPSASAGALSVKPELAGSASGLYGAMTVGVGAMVSALTGWLLTPDFALYQLFAVMLTCSGVGLFAALAIAMMDRRPLAADA